MGSESGDEKCSICLGPVEQPAKPDTCTVILTKIRKAKQVYISTVSLARFLLRWSKTMGRKNQ